MPEYVKKIAIQKLEEIKSGNTENYKHMDYVKTLVEYPWISNDYSDIFLKMDIEGGEFNLIENSQYLQNSNLIEIEFHWTQTSINSNQNRFEYIKSNFKNQK